MEKQQITLARALESIPVEFRSRLSPPEFLLGMRVEWYAEWYALVGAYIEKLQAQDMPGALICADAATEQLRQSRERNLYTLH